MVRKRRISKIQPQLVRIIVFTVMIFISFILIQYLVKRTQKKSVIESPKTEMKTVPENMQEDPNEAAQSPNRYVPILMYHYVENVTDQRDTIRKSLNVAPHTFEEQLKTLKDAQYTFMTAKQLGEVLDGKRKLPQKPVVLTFDDGHKDVFSVIVPLLITYEAKGTVYIITDFLGGSDFLTEQDLNAVIASGVMEIGAHTVHHVSLQNRIKSVVVDEVLGSKKWLEKRYHIQVVSFAYPNGAFDQAAANVAKDSGFSTAVSTIPGTAVTDHNRFFLYRLRPGYRTGTELLDYIESPMWREDSSTE